MTNKLIDGIENGILTDKEANRIYFENFDKLVIEPTLDTLTNNGFSSMADEFIEASDRTLPVPSNYFELSSRDIGHMI